MFQKTYTLWRRLIGQEAGIKAATEDEDRRLWVRYASDIEGQLQVTDKGYREKLLAKVRDLSQGGANLLVEKSLQPGQMVSLELPVNGGESHTVLACVVRATREDQGWSLGCAFSRELDNDDLRRFGAQKVKASASDQRAWVRYDCAVKARCRRYGDGAAEACPVQVLNVSASGIGLALDSEVDAGAMFTLDLMDKNGRTVCTILACVVHTTSRAGGCSVGCNFIRELSEEELQSLL